MERQNGQAVSADSLSDSHSPIETDAVIIGAGPVGIYLAFQLGLLEVKAHLIDALPYPGGQCVELYGDKPIYDIPGIPVCTGKELVDNLLQQVTPFAPPLHLGQVVTALQTLPDGRFQLETNHGSTWIARAIFIAGGAGAFLPRSPSIPGLHDLPHSDLRFHFVPDAALAPQRTSLAATGARSDAAPADKVAADDLGDVVILGDGDSALEAALALALSLSLAPTAAHRSVVRSVTLMHRRDVFTASPATQAAFRDAVSAGKIRFMAAQITGIDAPNGRLQHIAVADSEGQTHTVPANTLWVLQGLSPKLGPIAEWGLAMERRQLQINTETYATSTPGIYAVGDVITYPGKKKLIASGFHEAIIAGFASMSVIFPQRRVLLQYTSSSSHLQKLLGVNQPD